HNPEVDWKQSRVDMTRCPPSCVLVNPPVSHLRTLHKATQPHRVTLEEVVDEDDVLLPPAKFFGELVPEQYRHWKKVFDKVASERLPDHGPHNHAIDLKPEFE
ncbi:hypothetical protein PENSPDRAFT_536254, partial [Peniophora sp. CONT]